MNKECQMVDILVATYNGEKYLKEQIESLLSQTYKNIQIIVSDDCSKDGTRDILKAYEQEGKIKVYYQKENLGYVKNFEFLLNNVENTLYMLCDQDDVWKKDKVEKSVQKLEQENLDLVFSDLEVVDENLNAICKSYNTYMHLKDKINKYHKDYRMQYLYNCITGCTILSKKEFLKYVLPFPTNSKYMIHDYYLGLIACIKGKVGYIDEPLILYRQHGNNQVGINKLSKEERKLDYIRNLSLDVKIGIFETYVLKEEIFSKELQKQNRQALEYFKMIKPKKNFNFRRWNIFFKIFKYETVSQIIKNFLVLNLPFFARILFNIFKK